MDYTSLQDKVVLVTGASSGIGAHTAVELAKLGACVALTGRNADRLRRTADLCLERNRHDKRTRLTSDKVWQMCADLTEKTQVDKLIDSLISYFGKLDVVINCAGGTRLGNIERCDVEDLDWNYRLNVRAPFMLTKAVLPHLEKTTGTLLHMSALAGIRPYSFNIPFTTAAAGLNQFVKITSLDLAKKGIRTNSLNPATTESMFFRNAFSGTHGREPTDMEVRKHDDMCACSFPLGCMGSVEEAAKILIFLASDNASFITGVTVPFDGGFANTSYVPH